MSQYSPQSNIKVFCQPCWWSDDWDGTEYAMEYDPSRSFFAQLKELADKTPYNALETEYLTLKNCDYSNSIAYSKDCYLTYWADYCENVFYSSILNGLKSSSDCLRGSKSELCYESTGFTNNYRVFFSEDCDECVDVWFSRNCYSCTNCVGCVNLRGASNCIFNVKYSKEEYDQKIKEMRLDSWSGLKEVQKKAYEFWLTQPYREYHGHSMNLNVTGEYIFQSKNSKEGYIVSCAENCKYCQFITVPSVKDSMDYSGWGNGVELAYESVGIGAGASNVKFSALCFSDVENIEYSLLCVNGKNNFGCVNLKRKSYSILNKQYSKEEYEKLKSQIIEDMKNNPYVDEQGRVWSYGEFFQPGFGHFSYNKSNATKFSQKTREEASAMGYTWDDSENPTYVTTIKSEDLPYTIKETTDSVLDEVVECGNCKRSFKIVQGELNLLRKMGLPIPHECPKCRENARFERMNKPGMHHRDCNKCGVDIYTPYLPEDPKIVYCVKCYQALFA
jgi:CxxC-x17-CxxC domain-containing protein